MCNTPSLRNVIVKQFHQFLACFSGNIVSPCTEWYKKFSFFVKRHIAMHHGADTECTYRFQFYVIFCLYIFCHVLIAVLNTCPDIIQTVCPDTIFIAVLPLVCAGCDRLVFVIYKYRFDSGRTKFNPKCCFVCENRCFCFCCSHFYVPPSFHYLSLLSHFSYDFTINFSTVFMRFLYTFGCHIRLSDSQSDMTALISVLLLSLSTFFIHKEYIINMLITDSISVTVFY